MPRSERAQWARMDIDGVALLADLAAGISLARVLEFDGHALSLFGAAAASSIPLQAGTFNGSVALGASCNCSVLSLTPHANGTHTECIGHLTVERVDVQALIPQRLLVSCLLTIEPEVAGDSSENSEPLPHPADLLITRAGLERAWPAALDGRLNPRALVVRTQPNPPQKFTGKSATEAPFLSAQAANYLVQRGVEHLVLDVPSADRTRDGGALTAHRIFFGLPPASTQLAEGRRRGCTITELAYVPDAAGDGWYLLSLQAPAIAGDAVPSRPMLYPLLRAA